MFQCIYCHIPNVYTTCPKKEGEKWFLVQVYVYNMSIQNIKIAYSAFENALENYLT